MTTWAVPGLRHIRRLREDPVGQRVLARHPLTRKLVSVTYLSPELLADAEFRSRFAVESVRLGRIRDARVQRVRCYVQCCDGAAIVADHLPGTLLRALLRDAGTMGVEAALVLFKDMLLGLAAGHAGGLAHGDVKPESVLLTGAGRVRLIDFGLFTLAGWRLPARSTPFYLAPEQWNSAAATHPGDVYAATVTFFECLAGGPPFHASHPAELSALHQQAAPPFNAVPASVRELVRTGLAKDPTHRPSAQRFLVSVDQAAAHSLKPDWERRGRRELAGLLAEPSRPSGDSALVGLFGRSREQCGQPVRLAAALGTSLLLAVGMSSPPAPIVWLPKNPGGVSGFEGRPPVRAFPGLPDGVAGVRTGVADAAHVSAHQPAAMVARDKPAGVAGVSSDPKSTPSGSSAHSRAWVADQQRSPAEPTKQPNEPTGQPAGSPQVTSARTADPTPAPTCSKESSTSAHPPISDPVPVQPEGRNGPENPASAKGELADQVDRSVPEQPEPSVPEQPEPSVPEQVDQSVPEQVDPSVPEQPTDRVDPSDPDQPVDRRGASDRPKSADPVPADPAVDETDTVHH